MAHEEEDDEAPRRRRPPDDDDDDDAARPVRRSPPKSKLPLFMGLGAALLLCCGGGGFLIYYVVQQAGLAFTQGVTDAESRANMVRIANGARAYHDTMGHLPTNTYNKGKPHLSWRVYLLAYIGHDGLFKEFKLDEPWDSPHNKALITPMPAVFTTAAYRKKYGDGVTPYRAVTSPAGGLGIRLPHADNPQFPRGPSISDFIDGLSNVILIFESDEFVEWSKPDEVEWNESKTPKPSAIPGVVAGKPAYFNAVMADAMPKKVRRNTDALTLWRLFSRNDGNAIPAGWED